MSSNSAYMVPNQSAGSTAVRILLFRLQVLQPVALTSTVLAQDCSTFLSWVANTPLNH